MKKYDNNNIKAMNIIEVVVVVVYLMSTLSTLQVEKIF